MSKRMRRAAAMGGVAGLLAVAGVTAGAGVAVAEDEVRFSARDMVVPPGTNPRLGPWLDSGVADGKVVIAFSTKPLTGPAGDGAGLPAGFTVDPLYCDTRAGVVAVYVCQDGSMFPEIRVPAKAADMTTVHWGFAYVPKGGDLAAGVEAARTAGSRPVDATHGTGKAVVKTAAHAALNTIGYDMPTVPVGRTVHHRLRFHANDAGSLRLGFRVSNGQESGGPGGLRLKNFTAGPGLSCRVVEDYPHLLSTNVRCDVKAGDHTIDYDVVGAADLRARRIDALTSYGIYDWGGYDYDVVRKGTFSTLGSQVRPQHFLLARDSSGWLSRYSGTGEAAEPFRPADRLGDGWQIYDTITPLSPLRDDLTRYGDDVKPSAATRGRGDLVARDAAGTLWYYDRHFASSTYPFAPRVRIGGGWNAYDRLVGAGDADRDGYVDLVARDKAGVLWLYKGTGSFTGARFKTRVKVGPGWGAYGQLAGGADVTGDGRADLLARDKAGVLWLYRGTGSGTTPYGTRVRVGAGWGAYDQLVVAGDLTDDGKADVVARDTTGVLWLYKGTGGATAPFAGRTRIGSGWNAYNRVF
ncbi:FG-GAP repeat domain-containing protein [Streptomyces sp. NPDC052494]|uniref:FG-GAP repeat domain-containing protein n=1 Tax=Streptomyces sp. NPDC052494 TaxID=3365692 RepID=UPI0037D0A331